MGLRVDIEKKLRDITLSVSFEAEGGVLALLGASGCGKSMTLKCIAGIETPDRGRIELDGRVLYDSAKRIDLSPQERRVGYLFQQYALFPNMTVEQNIRCGLRGRKDPGGTVGAVISAMHLEGLEKAKPDKLSGGQQQRVAMARILVNDPELLLLDEPFSALDVHLRFQLEMELHHAIERFGKTVIIVSHDRDEVYRLSDRVAVMESGRLTSCGSKEEIFTSPRTRGGAVLIGCRNISALEKLPDGRVTARDWGIELTPPAGREVPAFAGIHAGDLAPAREGESDGVFDFTVTEVVENPFTRTLALHRQGAPENTYLLWKQNGPFDRGAKGTCVRVRVPSEALLWLDE